MRLKEIHDTLFNPPQFAVWAPGRINLIGEHTDYNGGWVLPAAIDRGFEMYFSFDENIEQFELYSKNLDNQQAFTRTHESLPAANWAKYLQALILVIKEEEGIIVPYFQVSLESSIPPGGGLSSSAAMNAGFLTGIKHFLKLKWSGAKMAQLAQLTEHKIGANVGIMDPYAVIYGEENSFIFLDCQSNSHQVINADFHDYALVLVDTKVTHNHAESGYNDRRKTCERVVELANAFTNAQTLRDLKPDDLVKINDEYPNVSTVEAEFIFEENKRVQEAVMALQSGDFVGLGKLMYASHYGLQNKYRVSCPELDFLVHTATRSGLVLGARMMGGGFGGSTINLIHKDNVSSWIKFATTEYESTYRISPSTLIARPSKGCEVRETWG